MGAVLVDNHKTRLHGCHYEFSLILVVDGRLLLYQALSLKDVCLSLLVFFRGWRQRERLQSRGLYLLTVTHIRMEGRRGEQVVVGREGTHG